MSEEEIDKRKAVKKSMPRKCLHCNGDRLYLFKDALYVGDNTGNDDVGVFCENCGCIGTVAITITTKRGTFERWTIEQEDG